MPSVETGYSQTKQNAQAFDDAQDEETDVSNTPVPPRRPNFAGNDNSGGKSGNSGSPASRGNQKASKSDDSDGGTSASVKKSSSGDNSNDNSDDTASAQSEADTDIASCRSQQSAATRCCNNPESCVSNLSADNQATYRNLLTQINNGPQSGQSISDYCSQMQSASSSSGSINNMLAGVCADNQTSCSSSCAQLASKYQNLLSSCSDCAAQSIYQSTLSTLNAQADVCDGLKSQANTLAARGVGSGVDDKASQYCAQNAGSPSGMGSPSGGSSSDIGNGGGGGSASSNDVYGCKADPTQAGCRGSTLGIQAAQAATVSFGNTRSSDTKDYAVGSPGDQVAGQPYNIASTSKNDAQKQQVTGIPANNSGGGIPGGNSGGGLNHAAVPNPRGSGPAESSKADVLQGLRSGGGYSQQTAGNSIIDESNGRGPASSGKKPPQQAPLDLKDYLPGGKFDPRRSVAGFQRRAADIHGPGVDIFERIHIKMIERCKLGLLWHCDE